VGTRDDFPIFRLMLDPCFNKMIMDDGALGVRNVRCEQGDIRQKYPSPQ
jgi:hypothetical protein